MHEENTEHTMYKILSREQFKLGNGRLQNVTNSEANCAFRPSDLLN